ncbi:ABC transporter permease [Streptomyces sp. NPDC005930]|uniref:ABC transporter permease n=1 Tax=Streptomyces sp. NPDC005930 TaxID=3364736 RepID=UPI00368BF33C
MTAHAATDRTGALRDIRLVYQREVTARLTSKGYFAGMLIMVVLVVAIVLGMSYLGAPRTLQVAACGAGTAKPAAAPANIEISTCTDLEAAREGVSDKDLDAAMAVDHGEATVLVRGDSDQRAQDIAAAMARNWALEKAYREQGVDVPRLTQSMSGSRPRIQTIGDSLQSKQIGAAVSLVIVLFMQIIGQGSLIAQGVVEEKSTRIVEVLLSTLTPLRLMIGKVAGIGTTAVLQILVLVGALVTARAFGGAESSVIPGATAVVSLLVWFLMSFALFAGLFAAAGSLVSRPEDLQSVLMPVMVFSLLPVGAAAAAVGSLDAPWVQVLQYLPPFSGVLIPLQAGVGNISPSQQVLAAAVMLCAVGGCMWLASRVYRNSILKIGATVRWRQALAA